MGSAAAPLGTMLPLHTRNALFSLRPPSGSEALSTSSKALPAGSEPLPLASEPLPAGSRPLLVGSKPSQPAPWSS